MNALFQPGDGTRSILVVDDHEDSRARLQAAFSAHGYPCTVCATTDEALGMILTVRPDVVIYEWRLRDVETLGFPVLVKALGATCGKRVLVLVASTVEEPPDFADRDHIEGYFTKHALVAALTSRA